MSKTLQAIKVDHLVKRYGDTTAVNDLSFNVKAGSVFAFLGTNGAGKSTTINCITTLLAYDSGTIEINGRALGTDDEAVRREIGTVFQSSLLDPGLTVRENLSFRAGLYGLTPAKSSSQIDRLAKLIGLETILDRPYGKISGGQKRRADIARSLLHEPSILFLDEPTTGLDPQSRKQVWDALHTLREDKGITVLLTTHYMAETEEADEVLIIDSGKMVAEGTPEQLREKYSKSTVSVVSRSLPKLRELCHELGHAITIENNVAEISVGNANEALELINRHKGDLVDFEFRHGTMDDVFLALTKAGEEE